MLDNLHNWKMLLVKRWRRKQAETPRASNGLIAVVSALVTGVILVPATYLINDFLARDHIGIEAVEFFPETTYFQPDRTKLETLTRPSGGYNKSEFYTWIEYQGQQTQDLFTKGPVSFQDADRQRFAAALDDFNGYLDDRLKKVEDLKTRWTDAIKKAPNWPAPLFPPYPRLPQEQTDHPSSTAQPSFKDYSVQRANYQTVSDVLMDMADENILTLQGPPSMIPPAREYVGAGLTTKAGELQKNKRLASDLAGAARDFKEDRTGGLWIYMTLINSGGTDGLVKAKGHIELVDRRESVDIIEQDSAVTKVEKRSIAQVWFQIDDQVVSNAKNNLRQLVIDGSNVLGIVELRDLRDRAIRSDKTPLPLAPNRWKGKGQLGGGSFIPQLKVLTRYGKVSPSGMVHG